MKKKSFILAFCICLFSVVLCSCASSDIEMPNLEDKVIGNGSISIVKGDYLYFVDSYIGYSSLSMSDNKYGKVELSAIYRTKLIDGKLDVDEDGVLKDYELIVPKVCGYEYTNLYIFDDYIYYATPTMKKDNSGTLRTDLITFNRVKLDGTSNQALYTTKNYSSEAKFAFYKVNTDVVLVVYDSVDLIKVNVNEKGKVQTSTLVEGISAVALPKLTQYEYEQSVVANQNNSFVYYTRDLTEKDNRLTQSNKGNILGRVSITSETTDNYETRVNNQNPVTYELVSIQEDFVVVNKTINSVKTMSLITKTSFGLETSDVCILNDTDDFTNIYILPKVDGRENGGFIASYNSKTYWVKDGADFQNSSICIDDESHTIAYADEKYVYYLSGTQIKRIDYTTTVWDAEQEDNDVIELVVSDDSMDTTYFDYDQNGVIYFFKTFTGDSGDSQVYLCRVVISEDNKILPEEDEESEEPDEEVNTNLGYNIEVVGVLKANHIATETEDDAE